MHYRANILLVNFFHIGCSEQSNKTHNFRRIIFFYFITLELYCEYSFQCSCINILPTELMNSCAPFISATKQLSELQKRLDTTERTMHLVMKQMEAVTKCLAKTLADDPALSGDKSLAEITEGLVNLKESNV